MQLMYRNNFQTTAFRKVQGRLLHVKANTSVAGLHGSDCGRVEPRRTEEVFRNLANRESAANRWAPRRRMKVQFIQESLS